MPARDQIRFRMRGRVPSRSDASRLLIQAGDGVLVDRGRPRLLVMLCPDGCGAEVTINLDRRAGPAWALYSSSRGVSLYPSVSRESGCGSHFIIWDDHIYVFGGDNEAWIDEPDEEIAERVLARLARDSERHYSEIASEINEVPWAVFAACRSLVRSGKARKGRERDTFSRLE